MTMPVMSQAGGVIREIDAKLVAGECPNYSNPARVTE